jgi:hypothetical protein
VFLHDDKLNKTAPFLIHILIDKDRVAKVKIMGGQFLKEGYFVLLFYRNCLLAMGKL